MIASLDTVTLAFMGMGIGIALAVLMLFNWHIQKKQPGVAWWAAAFVLAAVGIILTALRATAPLWLCILLANTCLQALWLLFWIGVKRFAGSSGNGVLFSVIALALNFCFMFYFVYVQPSLSARIILFCSINALFTSLCAKELLLHYRRHPEAKASLVAGWVCVFHVVFSLTRILLTARSEPLHNLLTAGGIHTLAFIEGGLILLVLGLLLIMMSSQRLQGELESHQQTLEVIASTDILSGTGNRRHFLLAAAQEIERARRYKRPLSLIMLDIDHFKNINDSYGHEYGDAVIKALGKMLSMQARESDTVCRIGGEEFAILMPETTMDAATVMAMRLHQILNATPVAETEKEKIYCTASMGLAELSDGDKNIYDLLPRADKRMYKAKQEGRNRIVTTGTDGESSAG